MRTHAPLAPSNAHPWYGHSRQPSPKMRPSESGARRCGQRSSVQRHAPPAGRSHDTWHDELANLLLGLQANLFYLGPSTIGLVSTACQLSHACRPNAKVVVAEGGERLRALAVWKREHARNGWAMLQTAAGRFGTEERARKAALGKWVARAAETRRRRAAYRRPA